jgi:misacylated tRNA(Ala) deacylase
MILHPVDDPDLFQTGDAVTCQIDVERRNGHALMHTAQHIVSALAEDLWGAETVGNQLTVEASRVDLLFEDKEVFNPDELVEATNTVISSNVAVNIHEWERTRILEHEQMRHTKFMHRIPPSITQLRVVEIDGVDLCPCAGTHVSNTSMIPQIKFQGKKNKGKGRIRFSYIFE